MRWRCLGEIQTCLGFDAGRTSRLCRIALEPLFFEWLTTGLAHAVGPGVKTPHGCLDTIELSSKVSQAFRTKIHTPNLPIYRCLNNT